MTSAAAHLPDPVSSSASSPASAPATTTMPPAASSPTPLFRILKTAAASTVGGASAAVEELERCGGPRLGLLSLPGRTPVATPAFFAVTSRGVVPHVTPDNAVRTNLINGAYFALEDFIENIPLKPGRRPPIFNTPLPAASPASSASPASPTSSTSPPSPPPSKLRTFTALPSSAISVLAPRRHPAAASHLPNGPHHISIVTSTGFQQLSPDRFHDAVATLRPDIAVPLADLTYGGGASAHTGFNNANADADASPTTVKYPSAKRALRMAERTEDWIDKAHRDGLAQATGAVVFAPTLPVPYATQWQYLNRLSELVEENDDEGKATVAGLAVYDIDLLPDLRADYADTLDRLPRLSLHPAITPHHVLRQVALGADIMLLPAITDASEHGLAYTFAWPSDEEMAATESLEPGTPRRPLAIDLADSEHKAAVHAPLAPGCGCAACRAHHRAYLHHLLDAREMLAWTLLQFHNHHVMAAFFAGIRATLAAPDGPAAFRARARHFQATYEPELPDGRATRPRARGYQVKTAGVVETKLNKPAWGKLEDVAQEAAAAAAPSPTVV